MSPGVAMEAGQTGPRAKMVRLVAKQGGSTWSLTPELEVHVNVH